MKWINQTPFEEPVFRISAIDRPRIGFLRRLAYGQPVINHSCKIRLRSVPHSRTMQAANRVTAVLQSSTRKRSRKETHATPSILVLRSRAACISRSASSLCFFMSNPSFFLSRPCGCVILLFRASSVVVACRSPPGPPRPKRCDKCVQIGFRVERALPPDPRYRQKPLACEFGQVATGN